MKYMSEFQKIYDRIVDTQSVVITQVGARCAETIAKGRAVLLVGAGHSALPGQEAFPRIGSIVGFVQITEPNLGFNGFVTGKGGQRQMSFLEQTSGYAHKILENYDLTPDDILIVFSNSGINAFPVEICAEAKKLGVPTVSVSSVAHSKANSPKTTIHKRLFELADYSIDNCTPEGDAIVALNGEVVAGGSSTIAAMLIMNSIVVETIEQLLRRGKPFFLYPSHNVSSRITEMEEKEESLFRAHKELIGRL